MHIPSPAENIQTLINAQTGASSLRRSRMRDGVPLFDKEDIAQARNDLDLEMRHICASFQIGRSYFSERAIEYYRTIEGHSLEKAKSDTQNLLRTLEKGKISNNRFEEALRSLGFEIIDRSVTFKDDLGEVHTFSTSKARAEIDKLNGCKEQEAE